jgi:integrase
MIQFKHFDHYRKRLTVFTKGGKIRDLPLPHPGFWNDLGKLIIEVEARPTDHLLPRRKAIPRGSYGMETRLYPEQPMGVHGLHNWWYACLQRAGVVPEGVTSGERMHKARHTAGQRVLDATGNLKAVQKLLGHESISTTGDVYTDWDVEQLAESLLEAVQDDEIAITPQGASRNPHG